MPRPRTAGLQSNEGLLAAEEERLLAETFRETMAEGECWAGFCGAGTTVQMLFLKCQSVGSG
jgi:hypothetical protein